MADMTAPSGQAPDVAPPVRSDEEIMPRIRWVPIRKSNCSLDLNKPIFGYLKFSARVLREKSSGCLYPVVSLLQTSEGRNIKQMWPSIEGFGNPNAGSVTSFGTVISFTDAFSASSSDKTWNLILRLETRRFFLNLESFVGRRVRKGDYRLLKLTE
nr:hypothetical protein [Tanacetum cinerariifolium]